MLRDRLSRRRAITFVVLVGLCLAMLAVSGSSPVAELRRGVNFAVSPVQGTLADGTRSITDVLGAFAEIESLRRENQDLQAQVDQLTDEVAQLESVRSDNEQMAKLLKIRSRVDHETVVGQVTSRIATQFERAITIDVGEESGVVVDAAVLSDGGALVGAVIDVGQGWSSVRLISDTRSLVVGLDLDSRTRATGNVVGRLSSPLGMREIRATDEVGIGDAVVTAGISLGRRFGSMFPKGLPIGRIVDVLEEPGSIVQTALIEPSTDLDRLEDVLVITDFSPPKRRAQESTE